MPFRTLIAALLLLAACSTKSPLPPQLPARAGAWTLDGPAQAAAVIPNARAAWSARYSGSPAVTIAIYDMGSTAVAFDRLQSWRAEPGKLAFYKGRFFGLAEAPGADQAALRTFVGAFERSLPD